MKSLFARVLSKLSRKKKHVFKTQEDGGALSLKFPRLSIPSCFTLQNSCTYTPLNLKTVVANNEHIKKSVPELYEMPEASDALKGVSVWLLMDVYRSYTFNQDILKRWLNFGGVQYYKKKSDMSKPLTSLIKYAEGKEAAPDIAAKVQFIAKTLSEDSSVDGRDIICLLATHGGVCNVMKEVGVRGAYALLTNTLKDLSLETAVLRLLYECREGFVEELFKTTAHGRVEINTHYLVGFRNAIMEEIGLKFIPDNYNFFGTMEDDVKEELLKDFFDRLYTVSNMVKVIFNALNLSPRRLSYNDTVDWFRSNRPECFKDPEDWLYAVFDDDGAFTAQSICYMLLKMDVLQLAPNSSSAQFELELFGEHLVSEEQQLHVSKGKEEGSVIVHSTTTVVAATTTTAKEEKKTHFHEKEVLEELPEFEDCEDIDLECSTGKSFKFSSSTSSLVHEVTQDFLLFVGQQLMVEETPNNEEEQEDEEEVMDELLQISLMIDEELSMNPISCK